MLMVIGGLVGLLLGLRFKALILAPAIIAAFAIISFDGIFRGDKSWQICFAAMIISTAIEVGYLGGCIIRYFWYLMFADFHSEDPVPRVPTSNV